MQPSITTFSGFDFSGNPSSISFVGSFTATQFTSFVNFLSSGQTGNYTYWTGGAGSTTGSYNSSGIDVSMQGVVANKINIKGTTNWATQAMDKVSDAFGYLINDLLYFEISGDVSVGNFLDIELKNGLGLNIGARSTIADFWYIKDAGQSSADYGADTYDRGEKSNFNFGGSFIGGVNYNITDKGENTVSVGYKLFGTSITWGGGKPISGFVGLDTGVSVGVGFGGSVNLKTGIKW